MQQPSPSRLVSTDGRVRTGHFTGSVRDINGRDFDYRTPMGAPQNAFARRFHYKQFQYFGIVSDTLLAGCALAHTAWLGLAFVYVYDTRRRELVAETHRLPLARGLDMSRSPLSGESLFRAPGARIRLGYREDAGTPVKTLAVETRKGLRIQASMAECAPFRPLSICTPTGATGWTYANKVAGVAVNGSLTCPAGTFDLSALDAFGHHDFSAGYMRRETFWNWACLSGRAGEHRLGLNISCGVNETSWSENCLWVDDRLVPVGLARFDFDRANPDSRWQVRTGDGAVDLTFTPEGVHREVLDLGLFATNFRQYFGRFDGVVHDGGRAIPVTGLRGFVEDQYAKW